MKYKIYQSTLRTPSKLLLETSDIVELQKKHSQCAHNLKRLKGGYHIVGTDGATILTVWYSDHYDEPIQSNHFASHPEYQSIWPKELRSKEE